MTAAHPSANSPLKGEALSLSCLPLIDEVTAQLCRRHRLSSDESEDFKSDVRLHFRHRDFDPLRQFEGRSSLQTYLTVVISRLLLDHRNGLSGRWRTSTDAKRLGPSAIPIERLVAHDVFWGLPDGGHARPAQKVTPLAGVEAYESADFGKPREVLEHLGKPPTTTTVHQRRSESDD